MRIKIVCLLIAVLLFTGACSRPIDIDESSAEEQSSQTQTLELERLWPYVTGNFMQPWAFTGYSADDWRTHFEGLLEVGLDTFIIQWTSETPGGEFQACYYPSKYIQDNTLEDFHYAPELLESCLMAAEELGMKVFVGLNLGNDWWDTYWSYESWNEMQGKLGTDMAAEIYELYKEKYPNALYGWYFAWEMYNGMRGYESKAGRFLNYYLEPLTELDADMPFMLSPFIRDNQGGPVHAGDEWTQVFQTANFREGDIFCMQDGMGADWVTLEVLEQFYIEIKRAVDTEKGLQLWANCENFTSGAGSATIGRFVEQMELAAPYVEGFVTFSYSHYYAADFDGKGGYHHAYKHYYDTGNTDADIEKPKVTFGESGTKLKINLYIKNTPYGLKSIYIYDGDTLVKEYDFLVSKIDEVDYDLVFLIPLEEQADSYYICVEDYFGNQFADTFVVE